jgi:hypothetical protein
MSCRCGTTSRPTADVPAAPRRHGHRAVPRRQRERAARRWRCRRATSGCSSRSTTTTSTAATSCGAYAPTGAEDRRHARTRPRATAGSLTHADGVIVTTRGAEGGVLAVTDKVYVCRNSIDPDDWPEPAERDETFRIGWYASNSHDRDSELVRRRWPGRRAAQRRDHQHRPRPARLELQAALVRLDATTSAEHRGASSHA